MMEPVTQKFCDERHSTTIKLLGEVRDDVKEIKKDFRSVYYGKPSENGGVKISLATLHTRVKLMFVLVMAVIAKLIL